MLNFACMMMCCFYRRILFMCFMQDSYAKKIMSFINKFIQILKEFLDLFVNELIVLTKLHNIIFSATKLTDIL